MHYATSDILLDKYRIETLLGQGAFGEVYRVTHLGLNVTRALKILRRDIPGIGKTEFNEGKTRFQLEAQLGAMLNSLTPHPNLLQVHNFEQAGDLLALEMEYAPGGSLAERLDHARKQNASIPIDEALQIALDIANGLSALHSRDIVHRDIKPNNILFDDKGRAKLADLGLAQIPGGLSMRSQLSNASPHPGTPGYMSPEQENNRNLLKPPSDVYALGLLLFEMLTGNNYSILRLGTNAASLRPEIPASLDHLLARMLEKSADIRPWDGREAAALLQAISLGNVALPEHKFSHQNKQPQNFVFRSRWRDGHILDLEKDVLMEFVHIPSGIFWMGSDQTLDPQAYDDEKPRHQVYLDEYLIGKTPVTNRQYQTFIQETNHSAPVHWKNRKAPSGFDLHPVVNINWEDADTFCKWASQISGQHIHLPSEAQWEKAARGVDERLYPWGYQKPNARLRYFSNFNFFNLFYFSGKIVPVSSYSPQADSPCGCTDMAGIVLQWCSDWYDATYYKNNAVENPMGPNSGTLRVLRGGASHFSERNIRSADRARFHPNSLMHFIGFRCACSL